MVLPAAGSRRRQVAELAARGHSFNIRSKPALHNKRMSDTKPPKFRCAPAPEPFLSPRMFAAAPGAPY